IFEPTSGFNVSIGSLPALGTEPSVHSPNVDLPHSIPTLRVSGLCSFTPGCASLAKQPTPSLPSHLFITVGNSRNQNVVAEPFRIGGYSHGEFTPASTLSSNIPGDSSGNEPPANEAPGRLPGQ